MIPLYLAVPAVCALVCISIGFINWQYLLPSVRLIIFECILSLFADLAGYYGIHFSHLASNHRLFNFFILLFFPFLLFGSYSLIPKKVSRIFYPVALGIFILIWLGSVFTSGIGILANKAILCSSFLITINYLIALFQSERTASAYVVPIRILCLSLVVYYCCTAPLFSVLNYLNSRNLQLSGAIYNINVFLVSAKFLLISLSFVLFRKNNTFQLRTIKDAIGR